MEKKRQFTERELGFVTFSDFSSQQNPVSHQLVHLAAGADEEFLIDSQGCVDSSGIQLELSSLCVQLSYVKHEFFS